MAYVEDDNVLIEMISLTRAQDLDATIIDGHELMIETSTYDSEFGEVNDTTIVIEREDAIALAKMILRNLDSA